jgi:tripartite-type tricarboxylate transporter receptor subunit TctC
VVEHVAGETAKDMQTELMKARLLADGSEAFGGSPQQFAAHLRAEHTKWSRVIKQAGIRGE